MSWAEVEKANANSGAASTIDLVSGSACTSQRVVWDTAVKTTSLHSKTQVSLHSLTEASAALAWRYDGDFDRFARDCNAVPLAVDFEIVEYVSR